MFLSDQGIFISEKEKVPVLECQWLNCKDNTFC